MSERIAVGKKVRVKPGVQAPDIPEISVEGWSGTVTKASKDKSGRKWFVEWDESTLAAMPQDFISICEERMLYHLMACFAEDDLESLE